MDETAGGGTPSACDAAAACNCSPRTSFSVMQSAGHLRRALGDAIVPRLERLAARVVRHGDAARHRADVHAQVATRALVPVGPRHVHAGVLPLRDGGITCRRAMPCWQGMLTGMYAMHRRVPAGHIAQVAADALLRVDV